MPILAVESGPFAGKRFRLPKKGIISIGRAEACQICLADPLASERHCVIKGERGLWLVEDRGSRLRTYVNNEPIGVRKLEAGDFIQVGATYLAFLTSPKQSRIGTVIISLIVFFVVGGILLVLVNPHEGARLARDRGA